MENFEKSKWKKKSKGEYIRGLILNPLFIASSAACLEAVSALTTGKKIGLETIVHGIKEISPAILGNFLFDVAVPYKSTRESIPFNALWAAPLSFAIDSYIGRFAGRLINPSIWQNAGHYLKYAAKAGIIGGVTYAIGIKMAEDE